MKVSIKAVPVDELIDVKEEPGRTWSIYLPDSLLNEMKRLRETHGISPAKWAKRVLIENMRALKAELEQS